MPALIQLKKTLTNSHDLRQGETQKDTGVPLTTGWCLRYEYSNSLQASCSWRCKCCFPSIDVNPLFLLPLKGLEPHCPTHPPPLSHRAFGIAGGPPVRNMTFFMPSDNFFVDQACLIKMDRWRSCWSHPSWIWNSDSSWQWPILSITRVCG